MDGSSSFLCRHRMTRPPPAATPWHRVCASDEHSLASAYLNRQSPDIHTSRSNSFASHGSEASARCSARQRHRRPSPGATPSQCVVSSALHASVRAVSSRMSPAAETIFFLISATQSASSTSPSACLRFRHSSTVPEELTLLFAASSSRAHMDLAVRAHALRSAKSRRQSAARRTTRRSRVERHVAENFAAPTCASRHANTRPSPGTTSPQKALLSAAHVSARNAS